MSERIGNARVFLGPEPERGAHEGLRGAIRADAWGISHEACAVEHLLVDPNDGSAWPMGEWMLAEEAATIPWHRVHTIQWGNEWEIEPLTNAERAAFA